MATVKGSGKLFFESRKDLNLMLVGLLACSIYWDSFF